MCSEGTVLEEEASTQDNSREGDSAVQEGDLSADSTIAFGGRRGRRGAAAGGARLGASGARLGSARGRRVGRCKYASK